MNKRQFIGSTMAAAAAAVPAFAAPPAKKTPGPALLTLTGAIGQTNRGPFDPALDQMMKKHKVDFDKAYTFDFAALSALPQHDIKPTLEYDGKVHALRGPLLAEVLAQAGVNGGGKRADKTMLALRAVDGYAVSLSLAQVRAQRFILATHLDGKPMALGGLGPLWAVIDADRLPELAAKPLSERFAACPWALYHIDVMA